MTDAPELSADLVGVLEDLARDSRSTLMRVDAPHVRHSARAGQTLRATMPGWRPAEKEVLERHREELGVFLYRRMRALLLDHPNGRTFFSRTPPLSDPGVLRPIPVAGTDAPHERGVELLALTAPERGGARFEPLLELTRLTWVIGRRPVVRVCEGIAHMVRVEHGVSEAMLRRAASVEVDRLAILTAWQNLSSLHGRSRSSATALRTTLAGLEVFPGDRRLVLNLAFNALCIGDHQLLQRVSSLVDDLFSPDDPLFLDSRTRHAERRSRGELGEATSRSSALRGCGALLRELVGDHV